MSYFSCWLLHEAALSIFFRTKLVIRKKQITIECFNGSLLEQVKMAKNYLKMLLFFKCALREYQAVPVCFHVISGEWMVMVFKTFWVNIQEKKWLLLNLTRNYYIKWKRNVKLLWFKFTYRKTSHNVDSSCLLVDDNTIRFFKWYKKVSYHTNILLQMFCTTQLLKICWTFFMHWLAITQIVSHWLA